MLGSTVVVGPGGPVDGLARKPRAMLAALALDLGRPVTADRLVDLVWGNAPPAGAHGTMHAYLSGLRRTFEPDLPPRAPSSVIVTTDDGYRLLLPPEDIDAVGFVTEVRLRHAALAPLWSQLTTGRSPAWPTAQAVAEHVDALERALGRWRGPAYADLGDHPDVLAERSALDERRATAQEDLLLGLLALGEHAAVVAASEQAVAREPQRERTRCLQALALVRSGRQVEALDALQDYTRELVDELGLDPGPEVQALVQSILRQEPSLWATLAPERLDRPDQAAPEPAATPDSPTPSLPATHWRTVGREREAEVVATLLEGARAGRPGALVVVGEPGIGKTRLTQDAVSTAREDGVVAAVARCSQDDGAPPLWPWHRLLEGLGVDPATVLTPPGGDSAPGDDDASLRAFAVQEALVRAVRARSAQDPVLLVVEDVHWADTRTLRALAHLVAGLEPADRVAVLLTRRPHPEPAGALFDLGVVLARQGAQTLELAGLGAEQARSLVAHIAGGASAPAPVETWCVRTGGNPFFLVELTRLGLSGGGWDDAVPESVKTVVSERLEELPESTRDVLVVAAALGREHPPLLLARVADRTPAEILDELEPAVRTGTVRVGDDGRLAFEHALIRDAVLATTPPGQLSRVHARIAQALESAAWVDMGAAERTFELARHWLAAGPAHAASAWPAAVAAATEARRAWANVEATSLYQSALASHALDPAATAAQRYDLLLGFAEVAARAARWRAVVEAVVQAVRLAGAEGDPDRVALAVTGLTRYNVWLPQSYGEVFEDLVDDLREAIAVAGDEDSATRCRLMLALAVQLYYATDYAPEVEALAEEGLALARRLGDAELRGWAARTAWLALWRPRYLQRRLDLAREEIEAARECGDEAAEAVGRAALAGAAVEAADLEVWTTQSEAAEAIAQRRRLPYVEFALGFVRLSLSLMAGRFDEAEAIEGRLRGMRNEVTTPADESLDFAMSFASATWRPELTPAVAAAYRYVMATTPDPFLAVGAVFQTTRAGELAEARTELARHPLPPVPDMWHATMEAAERADIAGRLGDRGLALQALDVLHGASGRMVVAGVSVGFGPVDGYLAVASAVLGEVDRARDAAARADVLAAAWGLAAYREWLAERRTALGF